MKLSARERSLEIRALSILLRPLPRVNFLHLYVFVPSW